MFRAHGILRTLNNGIGWKSVVFITNARFHMSPSQKVNLRELQEKILTLSQSSTSHARKALTLRNLAAVGGSTLVFVGILWTTKSAVTHPHRRGHGEPIDKRISRNPETVQDERESSQIQHPLVPSPVSQTPASDKLVTRTLRSSSIESERVPIDVDFSLSRSGEGSLGPVDLADTKLETEKCSLDEFGGPRYRGPPGPPQCYRCQQHLQGRIDGGDNRNFEGNEPTGAAWLFNSVLHLFGFGGGGGGEETHPVNSHWHPYGPYHPQPQFDPRHRGSSRPRNCMAMYDESQSQAPRGRRRGNQQFSHLHSELPPMEHFREDYGRAGNKGDGEFESERGFHKGPHQAPPPGFHGHRCKSPFHPHRHPPRHHSPMRLLPGHNHPPYSMNSNENLAFYDEEFNRSVSPSGRRVWQPKVDCGLITNENPQQTEQTRKGRSLTATSYEIDKAKILSRKNTDSPQKCVEDDRSKPRWACPSDRSHSKNCNAGVTYCSTCGVSCNPSTNTCQAFNCPSAKMNKGVVTTWSLDRNSRELNSKGVVSLKQEDVDEVCLPHQVFDSEDLLEQPRKSPESIESF